MIIIQRIILRLSEVCWLPSWVFSRLFKFSRLPNILVFHNPVVLISVMPRYSFVLFNAEPDIRCFLLIQLLLGHRISFRLLRFGDFTEIIWRCQACKIVYKLRLRNHLQIKSGHFIWVIWVADVVIKFSVFVHLFGIKSPMCVLLDGKWIQKLIIIIIEQGCFVLMRWLTWLLWTLMSWPNSCALNRLSSSSWPIRGFTNIGKVRYLLYVTIDRLL